MVATSASPLLTANDHRAVLVPWVVLLKGIGFLPTLVGSTVPGVNPRIEAPTPFIETGLTRGCNVFFLYSFRMEYQVIKMTGQ